MIAFLAAVVAILSCSRDFPDADGVGHVTPVGRAQLPFDLDDNPSIVVPVDLTSLPTVPIYGTPTPDPTRPADAHAGTQTYAVQPGDTLVGIARSNQVSVEDLMAANNIQESNFLSVGQDLTIPFSSLQIGMSNKLIPDSELVFSPGAAGFDVSGSIALFDGYLSSFSETDVLGVTRSGAEIVLFVSQNYSVNPRLLLAILEYQSGWVTHPVGYKTSETYPLGHVRQGQEGLLKQLSWAADVLNFGFYSWRDESLSVLNFPDGGSFVIAPGLNAGTASLQYFFSRLYDSDHWLDVVAPGGFDKLFAAMFDTSFVHAYEPLIPDNIVMPSLQLPWDTSDRWYYTGGPHGGWDSGSAWAAVDFAPALGQQGCDISPAWVLAAAEGLVVRSGGGAVIQDLDDDGIEQTGWTIIYMHIDTIDRVPVGQYLKRGDRVGHPSCEGGYSSASHLHLSRLYNGVWIAVDDPILPLSIDGWNFLSAGREYDGWMQKGDITIEAWDYQGEINLITPFDH